MTNDRILEIAMQQSAYDAGCQANDFSTEENIIVESVENSQARKYLKLPLGCAIARIFPRQQ